MLIDFKVKNFRSFRAEQTFSMVADKFPEHLQSNSFKSGLPGFGRFLRSAAIYGPNAAGKTNLLRAIQFMQSMVVNSAASSPTSVLPYSPFLLAKSQRKSPSEFQIAFVQNGTRYEYGFSMNSERICEEWLTEYANPRGRAIFDRKYDGKSKDYKWTFSSFLKGQRSVWKEATRKNVLFLSQAAQLNSTQLITVFEWFQKRLVVVLNIATMNPALTMQMLDRPGGVDELLPFLREADLGIVGVELKREPMQVGTSGVMLFSSGMIEQRQGSPIPHIVNIAFSHTTDDKEPAKFDVSEESAGTQALFRSAGAWLNVLANGEVLLFDEIDTSLHPKLTRFLIEKFHSDRSNPKNAQLIFTTHNTSFLDQELLRRDQVWFVDKDRDGASSLYPLTDFRPRNDESLERWYMRGRYGALPVLDESSK